MRGVIAAAATDDQCKGEDRCHVSPPPPPMVSLMQKQVSLSKMVSSDASTKGPVKTATDGSSTYAHFKGDQCGWGYDGGGAYGKFKDIRSASVCSTAAQKLDLPDKHVGSQHSSSIPYGCSYSPLKRDHYALRYKQKSDRDTYTRPNDNVDVICVKEFETVKEKSAEIVGPSRCNVSKKFRIKYKTGKGVTPKPSISDCQDFCSAQTGCKFFSTNKYGSCKTYKMCDDMKRSHSWVTWKMPDAEVRASRR